MYKIITRERGKNLRVSKMAKNDPSPGPQNTPSERGKKGVPKNWKKWFHNTDFDSLLIKKYFQFKSYDSEFFPSHEP